MSKNKLSFAYRSCNNADFLKEAYGSKLVLIRRSEDSSALRKCVDDCEKYLGMSELLKDSRSTKAGIVKLEDGTEVFIKRYNNKGFFHTLKYIFRETRAFHSWHMAWCYELNGIPTPRPLATIAKRKTGILESAYLIVKSVPDLIPALDFCRILLDDVELLRKYSDSVCSMFANMHHAGIRHGDTKFSNIYVRKTKEGYSFGLWDLDGGEIFNKPLDNDFRAAELARTISSYADIAERLGKAVETADVMEFFINSYYLHSGIFINKRNIAAKIDKYLKK